MHYIGLKTIALVVTAPILIKKPEMMINKVVQRMIPESMVIQKRTWRAPGPNWRHSASFTPSLVEIILSSHTGTCLYTCWWRVKRSSNMHLCLYLLRIGSELPFGRQNVSKRDKCIHFCLLFLYIWAEVHRDSSFEVFHHGD